MADSKVIIDQAVNHLRAGQVQEADDLLSAHSAELAATPPPPPPVAPAPAVALPVPSWVGDAQAVYGLLQLFLPLFEQLVATMGNPPAHVAALAKIKEVHAALAPEGK